MATIIPGSLILVHFIEQQLEGWTFERAHWPLHITLVPWFVTKDEEAVMRSLDRLAADTAQFTLTIGGIEKIGKRNANLIANQKHVQSLHKVMLETLEGADIALHESRFTGHEYRAHITRYDADGRKSNEGERVIMNDFHLVRLLDDDICVVEQQFMLVNH